MSLRRVSFRNMLDCTLIVDYLSNERFYFFSFSFFRVLLFFFHLLLQKAVASNYVESIVD